MAISIFKAIGGALIEMGVGVGTLVAMVHAGEKGYEIGKRHSACKTRAK
jgi:hypothetical protein